jgi:hypothetical protein
MLLLAPPGSSWPAFARSSLAEKERKIIECRSQEEPGRARRSQEEQGGARSQEEPGGARKSQEEPGRAWQSRAQHKVVLLGLIKTT